MAKKRVHQKMVKLTIANFFAKCYSTILKLELYCNTILKKKYILYSTDSFLSFHSLLSSLFRPNTISSLSSFSVGSGVWVVGCGSWLGCGSGVWVVGDSVGQ